MKNAALLADGAQIQTAELTEANSWAYTFTGLPKQNGDVEIKYTITEDPIPLYETEINNTQIINHYKPITTSLSVRKVWDDQDNKNAIRPKSILMRLNNGMSVVLNEENNWSATISDLPVIVNGKQFSYSWTEQEVLGYTLTDVKTVGTTTIFTNSVRTPTPPPDKPSKRPRGEKYTVIEDYDTPLGVEVVINHVGDCFD